MKRYILFVIMIASSLSIFAQKEVRKSIKKGNSAYKEQRYSVAEDDYKNALSLNEADADALYNLANAYYRQQKWDDAIKAYEGVLKMEKEDDLKSKSLSNMGNAFMKKESEKSNQQNNQMTNMPTNGNMDPQSGMPLPNQQAGQGGKQEDYLQKAIDAYKGSLRLNPNDDETRSNLAIAQKLRRDNDNSGGGGDDNQQDQNKDQNKDQDKDKQDQNKDQNQDKDKDKDQDKDKQDQDKQDQKDQSKDNQNKDEQNQGKISRENMQQILDAMEQDEKETQDKVNKMKAEARKEKSQRNKDQDKDW